MPLPTAKNLPTIGEESGKIGKKEEKLGKKRKNWEEKATKREGSLTLPLLTDRAGYTN